MIFVPKENIKLICEEENNIKFIIWNYSSYERIIMKTYKDENCGIKGIEIFDKNNPLHTVVEFDVLHCSCQCTPQLRFNKIINKWVVTCPSSMICTNNNDEDEIKHFKEEDKIDKFNEEKGFFDDPIKAICYWQKNIAINYINACDMILK